MDIGQTIFLFLQDKIFPCISCLYHQLTEWKLADCLKCEFPVIDEILPYLCKYYDIIICIIDTFILIGLCNLVEDTCLTCFFACYDYEYDIY
jgi:hypothetical protein